LQNIPFNKPFIVGKELYYISQAVITNLHLAGNGKFTKLCQAWMEENFHCRKSLLTHSCTAALEMAAVLCDIGPGDEIIMPSYTFVSTANAFVLRHGVPVFVDIRPDTLNIDEDKIETAITSRTKAIVPVHYAGYPCAMDTIGEIAKKHNLYVIEDAAQAFFSTYKNKRLGTLGDLGALSFHETKNIISGEGGALFINNPKFIERAETIWEKGTNRSKFFRGEIDKYTWVDIGSSYLPSEIIAAFLYAQLEHAEQINAKRGRIYNYYIELLQDLERGGFIGLPQNNPEVGENNGHLFYILTKNTAERSRLIAHLQENGIHSVFHYVPLHSSPAGKKYCRTSGELTVTVDISDRILRLPLFFEMSESDVAKVADCIKRFYRIKK
jgi:dTDP-4-amino-4,6-dideoxygalactose transaminase